MTRRRVEPSVFVIDRRGHDAQLRYALRLLVSGYDLESAAVLSGLSIEEVRRAVDGDGVTKGGTPP